MALGQNQKYRSMAQDRTPRDKPMHLRPMINDKDLGITKEEDMVEQMGDDR